MGQRLESAGTVIVEFEIIGIDILLFKEPGSDLVIGAGIGIGGVVVAAADMGIDEQVRGLAIDDGVVDAQVGLLDLLQAGLVGPEEVGGDRVHEHAPGAVIQLEPPAAGGIDLLDKCLIDSDEVCDQGFAVGIELLRDAPGERHGHLGQELSRRRDGKFGLDAVARQGIDKAEMLHERMLLRKGEFPGQEGVVNHGLLPVERKPGLGRGMTDPVEAPHEIKVPGLAAEFAIRNNLESQFFLLGDQVSDSRIFHFF